MGTIIEAIQKLLKITLNEIKVEKTPDPLSSLMRIKWEDPKKKRSQSKFTCDAQGHITGLNLSYLGLTDEKWKEVLDLLGDEARHLQALNLSDNQLTAPPLTGRMKALERLDMSGNQIKEFSLPPGFDALTYLNLDENPLEFPPDEILKQGPAAVLRFLKESAAQGVNEVYEVKMLIVGEGETGKTTLWNLLQNPNHPVPDKSQLSTLGVEIKEGWCFTHPDLPKVKFMVNLWDFGGQDIQYMTHQFFLTRRSFYVLLADGRRETVNFPYWLKIINLLGVEPEPEQPLPVLVVLNEKGNPIAQLPYDPIEVKKNYPNLDIIKREVDFGKKDGRFDALQSAIQDILCHRLAHLPLKIPANWNKVRLELSHLREKESRNHINSVEFEAICTRNSIDNKQTRDDLSQMLHFLGAILHFHDDPALADFIVLNPKWVANAVYEVMRHEDVAKVNLGRFDKQMLRKVWTECAFSDEEQGKLLNLMLKDNFEVCFEATEHGRKIFIAPQLLPPQRPADFEWQPEKTSLRYTYQYPFMPKGIIGRLIVRLNEYIETRGAQKVVWAKGTILKKDDCRALITETEDPADGRKLIKIEVQGDKSDDRKNLLRDIRQELGRIHLRSFPSLKVFQKIPCCCSVCANPSSAPFEHDFNVLKDMEDKNIPAAQCNISHEMVSVQLLLNGVFPAEHELGKASARPKTIYFSYAWGDAEETGESREKIVDELYASLKKDGHHVMRDKMDLEYGGLIANFMEDIGKGDLIVVFVSDKYLRSVYCMWELCEIFRNSLAEKERFAGRILPVRIENLELKDLKTLRTYLTHWNDFYNEHAEFVRDFPQQIGKPQLAEFEKSRTIKDKFGEVVGIFQDMNAKTNAMLRENDFAEIKNVILERLGK